MKNQGFTLLEVMVAVGLLTIIGTAGFMLFVSGQAAWSITDTKIQLQENLRETLQRISAELQESGIDDTGNLQVTILDNAGVNNTDVLRFSIPLCVCGTSVMDQNGEIQSWGAPLSFGQTGCTNAFVVGANNKVTICHVPPGNPNNTQTLDVNFNAVNAHLAHGDWLGDCASCDPTNYNNRTIEYRIDNNGRLLRQVLDINSVVINSTIFASNITDFQASLNAGQTVVDLSVQMFKIAVPNRPVTLNGSLAVFLKNRT